MPEPTNQLHPSTAHPCVLVEPDGDLWRVTEKTHNQHTPLVQVIETEEDAYGAARDAQRLHDGRGCAAKNGR